MITKKTKQEEQKRFDELYKKISPHNKLMYAGRLLERSFGLFPDKDVLIYKDQTMTYRQLYKRAVALSRVFKDRGVNRGDRVLLCFENSPEFYISYFAAWQAGAVVVPLNTFLRETELFHIVTDAQPILIITETDRVALFDKVQVPILTENDMPIEVEDLEVIDTDATIELDSNDMCALLYTSGTTGFPKGVMISSKNIMTNLAQGFARLGFESEERVFGVLPLFHIFAQNTCVWMSIFAGVTIILVPKIDRRLILQGLKHKPTYFLGVPALYGLLCLLKTAPIDSVKMFVTGGDALPGKIRMGFEILYRRKLCNGYGLTETSPLISVNLDDDLSPVNVIGAPVIGVEIAIRDEQGVDLAQGETGRMWVKGDNVMLGYYNEPEMTHKALKDGWFDTGDLAYITKDGKIAIAGRLKDLIIHKGLNIYPQEIENVLMSHPNVIAVGVIGKKDGNSGEIPIAYVQLRKEQEGMQKALLELCKQHLALYKIPREFICNVKSLPMTATGKVDKKVLRKELE